MIASGAVLTLRCTIHQKNAGAGQPADCGKPAQGDAAKRPCHLAMHGAPGREEHVSKIKGQEEGSGRGDSGVAFMICSLVCKANEI